MTGKNLYETDRVSLEQDTDISFFRGSGPGGQNRNKVETGVRLYHRPSNITVQAGERSSQARNREEAFARLRSVLQERNRPRNPRLPTKIPRSQKEQRLADKRAQSARKDQRKPPDSE
jgi:protein subunit release factor B